MIKPKIAPGGYEHTILKPQSYPSYAELEACEITIRDTKTGHLAQISIDDLFEAFKDVLDQRYEHQRRDW